MWCFYHHSGIAVVSFCPINALKILNKCLDPFSIPDTSQSHRKKYSCLSLYSPINRNLILPHTPIDVFLPTPFSSIRIFYFSFDRYIIFPGIMKCVCFIIAIRFLRTITHYCWPYSVFPSSFSTYWKKIPSGQLEFAPLACFLPRYSVLTT